MSLPFFTSCESDITSLNVDPKHPTTLPSSSFFSTAEYNLFEQMNTASVNRNISRFFTQQWTETTYTDESNYDMVTRQINTNHWNWNYRNVINTVKLAKDKLNEESAISTELAYDSQTKNNMWSQLEIIEIYSWANLVDTYNNIPYSQALKMQAGATGVLSPKYDDAKTIYIDLINRLTAVISKITVTKSGYAADFAYRGDMSKWRKLANSLKLRLGVNLADIDATLAKSTIESAVASGVFTSNTDNFVITYTPGQFSSPLYQTVNVVGSGRKDFVAADVLVDAMNAKLDPRRSAYFTTVDGNYVGGVYADNNNFDSFSHVADNIIKQDAVGDLFDYSEVCFLLAEAAQRTFSVGDVASSWYAKGIQASMDYWGVSATDATTYIAANPYDSANWKKSIGEQSWYAMYNRGYEAWTFNKRLDYPVFQNPGGSVVSGVPVRMTYPAPEQSLNKTNWQEAVTHLPGGKDVATAKVFWDKF